MKTIIIAAIIAAASVAVLPEKNTNHGDKYCAKKKGGVIHVMHEGAAITTAATLSNGSVISPNGSIKYKDGKHSSLREGQCVGPDGKMMDKEEYKKSK
jgi:hypothetical protein